MDISFIYNRNYRQSSKGSGKIPKKQLLRGTNDEEVPKKTVKEQTMANISNA
jgi:hypothetical protein